MAEIREAAHFYRQGNFRLAETQCGAILSRDERNFDALFLLAAIKLRQNALAEARELFQRLAGFHPNAVAAAANLAFVLSKLGESAAAVAEADRALRLSPGHAGAWVTRGDAMAQLDRADEALESYDRALAIDAGNLEALIGRGGLLPRMNRPADAIATLDRIPAWNNPELLANRANLKRTLGLLASAAADFRRLSQFDGYRVSAWIGLVSCASESCDWDALKEPAERLLQAVDEGQTVPPFFVLQLGSDPAQQLKSARAVAARPSLPPPVFARPKERPPQLRIAYISPDFRVHPLAYLIVQLLEKHDRERFHVTGISLRASDDSEIAERIARGVDQFEDMHGLSEEQLVSDLRRRNFDMAVDLAGYTEAARPRIFAERVAPIQVSYLGYCGTSGGDAIDYLIADRIAVPPSDQGHFSENIVYLPDSFMVADASQRVSSGPLSREQFGLPGDAFVFCCFNKNYKISRQMFEIWMRLLRSVEGSVLWLSANAGRATDAMQREAERHGVDPARIVFAAGLNDRADHLGRLKLGDLFLDTLPYNAHTTACDALFIGLPVVTSPGSTFVGRVAASMLHALGLDELVASNLSEYEALALTLALDRKKYRELRSKLEAHEKTYPLFQTDVFRGNLEKAYDTMHGIYRAGEKPRSFAVEI